MRRLAGIKIVHGALFLSVVLNVALGKELSKLRATVHELKSAPSLEVGTLVPSIHGLSMPDGARRVLAFSDVNVPTVLYVFTPQCIWCKRNIDNLRVLIENAGSRYRVIGISLNSQELNEYLDKFHLIFPVISDIDPLTKSIYHFGATPTTIVVSPQSVVQHVWTGVYDDDNRKQIDSYLKIQLPGCCKLAERE